MQVMKPSMPAACRKSWRLASALTLCAAVLGGCASWLPRSHTDTTAFDSYDQARAAVEALVPMKSVRADLEHNGFHPSKHPNMLQLTHAEVARRYLPSALLRREDLAPGILRCLEAGDACQGLEIAGAKIKRERTGNFWADFLNFRRQTQTTGWRFTALVLLVNDVVVYRSWSGQPAVNEVEVTRNPLGPLQDIGPAAVGSSVQ